MGSGHTESMCVMRRSVNDRDDLADKMLVKGKRSQLSRAPETGTKKKVKNILTCRGTACFR